MKPKLIRTGVTRLVLLWGPYAFKFPRGVRGWLANQSEWQWRHRNDVTRPYGTLFHFVTVYPRADFMGVYSIQTTVYNMKTALADYSEEEQKPSNWGWFGGVPKLVDYDRAWQEPYGGLIGRIYYWNQARLARKWMKLPRREGET